MTAPERGDFVWLDFDPQIGREQAGRRPALVISPRGYHQTGSLAIVCPITSTKRGNPFEVLLPPGLPIQGVVLADQVKSIDRHARRIEPAGKAPDEIVEHVIAKILPLIGWFGS